MIKWIGQDIKRTLLSRKTFLLITVIILTIISSLLSGTKNHQISHSEVTGDGVVVGGTYDTVLSQIYRMKHSIFDYRCVYAAESKENAEFEEMIENKTDDYDCTDFSIYNNYLNQLLSGELSDTETFELELFILNITTDNFIDYYDSSNEDMKASLDSRVIDINLIRPIKKDITENINPKFELFEFNDTGNSPTIFNDRAINMYETYLSLENNYPLSIKSELTSSFFVANYLNDYFLILVIIGALMIFDSYYRDYKSGVIKTILSSPRRRFRYVIMKTISTIISMLIIILIPLFVTAVGLYLYNGYDSSRYPIYISRTTLNSFDPVLKYSKIISPEKSAQYFSTYKNICSTGPVSQFPVDITGAKLGQGVDCSVVSYANISIILLSKYIPIVILYFILVFVFISTLNTLFSMIFENQITNLIALAASIGASIILNRFMMGHSLLKFLPFTFVSPTALLMGTVPYTMYNGVITLGIWTVILIIINYIVVKRKDFAY